MKNWLVEDTSPTHAHHPTENPPYPARVIDWHPTPAYSALLCSAYSIARSWLLLLLLNQADSTPRLVTGDLAALPLWIWLCGLWFW